IYAKTSADQTRLAQLKLIDCIVSVCVFTISTYRNMPALLISLSFLLQSGATIQFLVARAMQKSRSCAAQKRWPQSCVANAASSSLECMAKRQPHQWLRTSCAKVGCIHRITL